jgi:glycosyltransferase involved in cell wall biosynthesis
MTSAVQPEITFLLPFYNEEGYIGRTVASLATQTDRRFRLVLVDNASTDGGHEEALAAAADMADVETTLVREPTPGKIHALQRGLAEVATPYVATIDADTIYPAAYTEKCLRLFSERPKAFCVIAAGLSGNPHTLANVLRRLRTSAYGALLPNRAHSGGCGQVFVTQVLREVGGFDPTIWPYVLEDHEVICRIARKGSIAYAQDHYCSPSDRRTDRENVSWNLAERMIYKVIPARFMGWYFHNYLAHKFEKRGQHSIALRSRSWETSSAGRESPS